MRSKTTGRFIRTHGLGGTNIYKIWSSMIARCSNPSRSDYKWYGERRIKVCKRWRDSILNFVADIGYPPSSKHSLDRIDNDGNYKPSNCRWATPKEQARNRSTSRMIAFDGKTQSLAAWAEEVGLRLGTLHFRLKHMPIDKALLSPLEKEKTHCRHGHAFTETNTAINSRNARVCKTCKSRISETYRLKRHGQAEHINRGR
jgi:hypothetical protein